MHATLLALLIEITSVKAAGSQLAKPITGLVKAMQPKGQQPAGPRALGEQSAQIDRDRAFKQGMNMLATTARKVRR